MEAQNSRTEYTDLMLKSEKSELATKQFLAKAKHDFQETKSPVYESYIGVGNFFMAKHAINPFSKMSYFKKGKKYLESAVAKAPNNLEIRFMRYTCQVEMPSFLGYNKNIVEDKKFIEENYKNSKDLTLVKQIDGFLKN